MVLLRGGGGGGGGSKLVSVCKVCGKLGHGPPGNFDFRTLIRSNLVDSGTVIFRVPSGTHNQDYCITPIS